MGADSVGVENRHLPLARDNKLSSKHIVKVCTAVQAVVKANGQSSGKGQI